MMFTTRDRFQLAAFHTHYKINMLAEMGLTEAFVKAVAATSDQATRRALERNPDAIGQWERTVEARKDDNRRI